MSSPSSVTIFAHVAHRLVAETQANAEGAKRLQDAVIVFDKQYHLIVGFVHLMILHTNDYLFVIMWAITTCKVIKKKRNGQ